MKETGKRIGIFIKSRRLNVKMYSSTFPSSYGLTLGIHNEKLAILLWGRLIPANGCLSLL